MTKARTLADNYAADINQVSAGVGITGGGTSGTVTITNDMATSINAKGDLVVGTANDTYSRLAVASTAGYVLTVDSAEATGVKWAAASSGSMTLLNTVTMSGASAITQSTDFTGYRSAVIEYENVTCGSTWNLETRLNASTTLLATQIISNNDVNVNSNNGTNFYQTGSGGAQKTSTRLDGLLTINNPASTSAYKVCDYQASYTRNTAGDPIWSITFKGVFRSASAITSIVFDSNATNFTGGTIRIYGVK